MPESRALLDEAITHLERAVRLAPENGRYGGLLGEAYLLRGDCAAAVGPLERSLESEPLPRTAYLLARALLGVGRAADAERVAGQALAESGGFQRAWMLRAEARRAQQDLEGALADLRQARAFAPDDEETWIVLAELLLEPRESHKPPSSAALLEARELLQTPASGRLEGRRRHALAGLALAEGDPAAALAWLDRVSEPSPAAVALRAGEAHLRLGRFEEAALALRQAAGDPGLVEAAERWLGFVRERRVPPAENVAGAPATTEILTGIHLRPGEHRAPGTAGPPPPPASEPERADG